MSNEVDVGEVMPCHTEGQPVVWLPFSAYEVANLDAMFTAIFPNRLPWRNAPYEPHPFDAFNTGDWTAVCHDRFHAAAQRFASQYRPNATADEMRHRAAPRKAEP